MKQPWQARPLVQGFSMSKLYEFRGCAPVVAFMFHIPDCKCHAMVTLCRRWQQMTAVGFEPTQLALVELESTPSDHSVKLSRAIFRFHRIYIV